MSSSATGDLVGARFCATASLVGARFCATGNLRARENRSSRSSTLPEYDKKGTQIMSSSATASLVGARFSATASLVGARFRATGNLRTRENPVEQELDPTGIRQERDPNHEFLRDRKPGRGALLRDRKTW